MIVAIYARKSTEQNGVADEPKSVARQVKHAHVIKKGWYIVVLAVLIVPALDAAGQGFIAGKREPLRGLRGVGVTVEDLSDDAERDGLTRTAIQTDTELKLRLAGVRVLSPTEKLDAVGTPFLYVNVNPMKDNGRYTYSIVLQLCQEVQSVVRPGVSFLAATWQTGEVGSVGAANLKQARDGVKDQVDEFINDYLAVNPKNAPEK